MNIETGDVFYWESDSGNHQHKIEILEMNEDDMFGIEFKFKTLEHHNNNAVGSTDWIPKEVILRDYKKMDNTEYGKQKRELNI